MNTFLTKNDLINESLYIKNQLKNPLKINKLTQFVKNQNIFDLLNQYLPEIISINHKNIAVVGNGNSILKQKYSKKIDSNDSVIRINDYSIEPIYSEHTGTKTTMVILNECCIVNYLKNGIDTSINQIVLVNPVEKNYGHLLTFYCYLHFINDINKDKFLLLSPIFRKNVCKTLNHEFPSSGFFAVMIAKSISNRISLYGFNVTIRCSSHYQKISKLNYQLHKFNDEYSLYKKWKNTNFTIYG